MLSRIIPVLYESVDIIFSGYKNCNIFSLSVLPAPSAKFDPVSPCLRWFKRGQSIDDSEKGDVAWRCGLWLCNDPQIFLETFQATAKACQWSPAEWALWLLQLLLLLGEAPTVALSLPSA